MASDLQADTFQSSQDQMRDQFSRIINALYGGSISGGSSQNSASGITPAADVIEDDNGYRLIFDVPGVDPRHLEVNVTGNTLSVRAQRETEATQALREQQNQQGQQSQQSQQRRQHILLTERRTGTFRREFRLPEDADRNRINAEFRNGVLTLTVNRSQETNQRRRIEIKSA